MMRCSWDEELGTLKIRCVERRKNRKKSGGVDMFFGRTVSSVCFMMLCGPHATSLQNRGMRSCGAQVFPALK